MNAARRRAEPSRLLPDADALREHIACLDREAARYRRLLRAVLLIDPPLPVRPNRPCVDRPENPHAGR